MPSPDRGHTYVVKQIGTILLVLVAAVGLYALPAPTVDACPAGEEWECVVQLDADLDVAIEDQDLVDIDRSGDAAGSNDPELTVTSDGELLVPRDLNDLDDDVWAYELLGNTKWTFDLSAFAADGETVAIVYDSKAPATGAPRVMTPQPARLQILDIGDERVAYEVELPTRVERVMWTTENRLVLIGPDGGLTVFARA